MDIKASYKPSKKIIMIEAVYFYIASLFRPSFKSELNSNKEKWAKIQKVLTEKDISTLQEQVYIKRSVESDLLNKVKEFTSDIENDLEYTRLGFPFTKEFESRKQKIVTLYDDLRKYIQVPYWRRSLSNESDNNLTHWDFDREYFDRYIKHGHVKYINHLQEASDIICEIRKNYREMSYLVNINILQIPFYKYIINN